MVKIDPDINIADFASSYPEAVNFLIYEYGFHCVNCIVSNFETLRQGASVHGIEGADFEEMMQRLEEFIEKSLVA